MAAAYLKSRTFREPNAGPPLIDCRGRRFGREPSRRQIERRAALVRRSWSASEEMVRRVFPHLEDVAIDRLPHWTPPVVSVAWMKGAAET